MTCTICLSATNKPYQGYRFLSNKAIIFKGKKTYDIQERYSKDRVSFSCYLSPVLTPLESLRYTKSI
jgi:hypothetical protein